MTYRFPFDPNAIPHVGPPDCGRPTRRRTACRQSPLAYWQLPKRDDRPHSCLHHLTSEERAEYDREVAAVQAAQKEAYRRADQMAPACWGWTVPSNPVPRDPATSFAPEEVPEWTLEMLRDSLKDPEVAGLAVIREWQAGRCGICSKEESLVTDHDHSTGLVRGLLCRGCNTAEGFRTAGPYRRYRERPPAAILGVKVRYWDPLAHDYARPVSPSETGGPWTDAASEDIGL